MKEGLKGKQSLLGVLCGGHKGHQFKFSDSFRGKQFPTGIEAGKLARGA